jgi:hypothetical protein
MSSASVDGKLCQKAAAFIVKYDVNQGNAQPLVRWFETTPDPTNRDGKFANFDDIVKCGEDVAGIGHSLMYARAIVTQLPVVKDAWDAIVDFGRSRHAADKRLPPVDEDRVMYSGSAGNTMFLFLGCVANQSLVPSTSFLGDETGRLSIKRLRDVSESFAEAFVSGVPTIVLSRKIRTEEPEGLTCIQAAENAKGSVQRLDHEIAIMKRTCNVIADATIFKKVGLHGIVAMIKDQVPHLASDIEGIAHHVVVQGGCSARHVQWLADQHEAYIPSARRLKGCMWEALATLLPPSQPHIRRLATFMCFSCPRTYVRQGFVEWLSVAELRTFVNTEGWVRKCDVAEDELCKVHKLFISGEHADMPRTAYLAIMGRCENRVGRYLFEKKVEGLRVFDSLGDILDEMKAEVKVAVTTHVCACVALSLVVQSVWTSCVGELLSTAM